MQRPRKNQRHCITHNRKEEDIVLPKIAEAVDVLELAPENNLHGWLGRKWSIRNVHPKSSFPHLFPSPFTHPGIRIARVLAEGVRAELHGGQHAQQH